MVDLPSLRVSEVVIIQSLEDHEFKTGDELAKYLVALDAVQGKRINVRGVSCGHVGECLAVLQRLAEEAQQGLTLPIVHFECHGSVDGGLEFSNGSELSWEDLGRALRPLNAATGINLLVFVSACYGGHLVEGMETTLPAPCLLMVGPHNEMDPGEVQASFRAFYRTLFETGEMHKAERALKAAAPHVLWEITHAEQWFSVVCQSYVKHQCTPHAVRARALELYKRGQRDGLVTTKAQFKQMIVQANRTMLTSQSFDHFFMLDQYPQNRRRFQRARERLVERLARLRRTGRYLL